MERIAKILFIALLVFSFCVETKVYALDSSTEESYSEELDEVLSDYGIGLSSEEINEATFGGIAEKVAERSGVSKENVISMLGTLMIVTVISAVLKNTGKGILDSSSEVYSAVCTITAASVIAPPVFKAFSCTLEAVKLSGGFITAFIPVFWASW